jgi:hypothetical protein
MPVDLDARCASNGALSSIQPVFSGSEKDPQWLAILSRTENLVKRLSGDLRYHFQVSVIPADVALTQAVIGAASA